MNAIWIFNKPYHLLSNPAWVMGCFMVLAYLASIIVDIDHPIAWALEIANGRFLMPYFNIGGVIALSCGTVLVVASLCRYTWIRFLKHSRNMLLTEGNYI